MTVLSIDPGTLRMGYGVVREGPAIEAVDYGVVSLPSSMRIESRLYQMHSHILNMIAIFHPDALAVEDPFVGRGERSFPGSSLAIGQAQAAVFIGAASQGIEIFQYAPAQIKRAVADYGAASKEQIRSIVSATLGLPATLEIDAADALAVGLCHLAQNHASGVMLNEIPPGQER
jgi:crossover junction endodeoxyribonuclease RuvC